MNKITLANKEAIALLPEKETIRTLKSMEQNKNQLMESFYTRDEIISYLRLHGANRVGSNAESKGFCLTIENQGNVMFVEGRS